MVYILSIFGHVPPEPQRQSSILSLAPKFQTAINQVTFNMGASALVYETIRTPERQQWLYGFGRDYDDGRGIITNAQSAQYSWHFFGLAVDIIHHTLEWEAPQSWWKALANAYVRYGQTAGGNWRRADTPHGQWGGCRTTPSDLGRQLYANGGVGAVWTAVGAV